MLGRKKSDKKNQEVIHGIDRLILWSNLASIFLVVALSCLLGKYAQGFWFISIVSILGLIATFYWGIKGLLLSSGAIIAILLNAMFEQRSFLLSTASVLSWSLLLLGRQKIHAYFISRASKEQTLEEKCLLLQRKVEQLQEPLISGGVLQKKLQEVCLLKQQLQELRSQLCIEKQEKSIWKERHCTLIQEVSEYKCKEKDFQEIVEKLQSQVASMHLIQTELEQAQTQAFCVENTLLGLQKECEGKELELDSQVSNFTDHIMQMQETNEHLAREVQLLEEIISSMCKKNDNLQKKQHRVSKEKSPTMLLREKINKAS
jgi:DNA repair exonuclease SbcCD ATPase subunit